MSFWLILQILLSLFLFVSVSIFWIRLLRSPQEDPRLSRGLRLLQSKIAVLEDLSDRTDRQSEQMLALMDKKGFEIHKKIELAELHIKNIESSMEKSRRVARLFEEKIPHEEIIRRRKMMEMFKAARMAHGGSSVEEISKQVELPGSEIEFIAKVNREQLIFSEELLPSWATGEKVEQEDLSQKLHSVLELSELEKPSLKDLGEQFRQVKT